MSSSDSETRRLFEAEVVRPDHEVNLGRAALLVAREEYPQLSVERYLTRLDLLAEEVRDRLNDELAPPVVLQEMLGVIFRRHNFRGNRDVYYDPRNSLFSDVLDRGLGIPLTLGIVVLEVGWRLELPLVGVNFPGHFLVRFEGEVVRLLVDPFERGRIHFHEEAQALLDRVYGGMVRLQPSFLRQASRREMLVRLLTNMKSLYLNVRDDERALAVVERLLLIHPLSPGELRDRGTLLARLDRVPEAVEQLETYLELSPTATDANRIRVLLERLREDPSVDRRSSRRPKPERPDDGAREAGVEAPAGGGSTGRAKKAKGAKGKEGGEGTGAGKRRDGDARAADGDGGTREGREPRRERPSGGTTEDGAAGAEAEDA